MNPSPFTPASLSIRICAIEQRTLAPKSSLKKSLREELRGPGQGGHFVAEATITDQENSQRNGQARCWWARTAPTAPLRRSLLVRCRQPTWKWRLATELRYQTPAMRQLRLHFF